jgi:TonB family protein
MKASEAMMPTKVFALVCLTAAIAAAQAPFSPARYRSGGVPPMPSQTVGGGEVRLEVDLDGTGRVTSMKPLRTTPPFADLIAGAVRTWQFEPAEEAVRDPARPNAPPARAAAPSKVLVTGLFRPPTLNTPTLGEAPRDVAAASEEIPVPLSTSSPPYPPNALNGGVVLLEAMINASGSLGRITVLQSSPPFDAAARTALESWRFRPARRRGEAVASYIYVMFGFAAPIVGE